MDEGQDALSEGPPTEAVFVATDEMVRRIRGFVEERNIDEAVALYESCVQNVGEHLFEWFQSSSVPTQKAIANVLFRARDYERAGRACEVLEEWPAAGRSYAASYDYARAADCYLRAEDKKSAAAMFEKAELPRRAAELYYEAGVLGASARALEKSGDPMGAGQIYLEMGDDKRAAELLAKVPSEDTRYLQSVGLLAEVLVRLDQRELARQTLDAVVPKGRDIHDELAAELTYRFGRLCWEAGDVEDARAAFSLLSAWDDDYRDVKECLRGTAESARAHPMTNPFLPMATTQVSEAPPKIGRAPTDPFGTFRRNPFLRANTPAKALIGPPTAQETGDLGFVQRMTGYEILKTLPIFEALSLDEMKSFYRIWEQVSYPEGSVLIEHGQVGEGLFIITEGSVQIAKLDEGGDETVLAILPRGKYVGEMSLVDDAPTSARVTALEPVKALRVRRDRFEAFLFTNDLIALRIYRTFVRTLCQRLRELNARV